MSHNNNVSWATIYKTVLPYIVSIQTPQGSGTGFLFTYNEAKTVAGLATAAHVVEYADKWKLPIKIVHFETKKELFSIDDDRVIFVNRELDSASILLFGELDIGLPQNTLPLIDSKKILRIGVEVGWIGFPSIASSNSCFFTGPVSTYLQESNSYLIDGVAINGVSGGPVFYSTKNRSSKANIKIIGTVSAYMPNRIYGDTLPGLMRVQDVTEFHERIKMLKSLDEAKKKKAEQVQKQREEQSITTTK